MKIGKQHLAYWQQLACWVLLCSLLPAAGVLAANTDFTALDTFIEQEMARERVPGLALAVIQDGKVSYMRGYGYRDVEAKLPVTPQTVFAIGSISKSFTVLTLGALAQKGQLDWDAPVRHYLPDFELYDRHAGEHMSARDLVTHRSGLPRHDQVWYSHHARPEAVSRQDYWQRLRYLAPTAEFRTRYQYNNLMFLAAGYLAGRVAGMEWEQLAEQRLFAPLEMHNSYTGIDAYARANEPARPYQRNDAGEAVRVPYADIDAIGPAGSINSTVEDMSHYLLALMSGGQWQGRQVLDADTVRQMQMAQTIVPGVPRHAELGAEQYGMGLRLSSYRGWRVAGHGGAIDGFNAQISWLPEKGIGVVVLNNLNSNDVRITIPNRVFDLLLGLPPIDWPGRLQEAKARDKAAAAPDSAIQHPNTRPSRVLAEYAGEYHHPAYGVAKVSVAGNGLFLEYNSLKTSLAHLHYDIFQAPADPLNVLQKHKVRFGLRLDGDVDHLAIRLEPAASEAIVFLRDGGAAMREAGFQERFTGRYALGSRHAKVTISEGELWFGFEDQPRRKLRPLHGSRFALGRDDGIEFLPGDHGGYERLVLRGSSGDLSGTRVER